MNARGVQRILEKLQGLAETAEHLGMRNAEMVEHEPDLSEAARRKMARLYREQSLRLLYVYSTMGEQMCDVLRSEAGDNTALGLIDLFQANFAALRARSRDKLRDEIGADAKLG